MSSRSSQKPWEHAKASGSEADPVAARFVASLDYDIRLYKHDIRGSLAHARMLEHVGLISARTHRRIEQGLRQIEREIDEQGERWPGWKLDLEDVHMCIEAALIEKTGDAGRQLHTGRSRNDQVALDLKLWIEDAADRLSKRFDALLRAFVERADRDGRIVMPAYTHLQRAQPILAGAELLAWADALERCRRRTDALRQVDRTNPLGAGAIAGSSLPIDRALTSELLELGSPTSNSLDATASRDAAIDFVYALSMTAMWLSRWAEQWILYASTEFGFITLDGRYTTGSSMMPQKQNPDMLELIRGRCGNVYGDLVALLTLCKGLTLGYNRDLQEDKRRLFTAFDTVHDAMEIAAGVARTTRFNTSAIRAGLDRGFLDATSLAEYLVSRGAPFRTSHQMVGRLVRACTDRGLQKLAELSVADMNEIVSEAVSEPANELIGDDVYDWLGPEQVVHRYRSAGNAGASGVEAQLQAWKDRLGM